MNGRVAVTLKREARKESVLTGEKSSVIYRKGKKAYKSKTYPWQKEPKVNEKQQAINEAVADMAEKVWGLSGPYPVARRSNLNSRQRRRDSIIHSTIITQSDLTLDCPVFIEGKFNPDCLKAEKKGLFSRTRRAVFMDFEGNQTLIKSIR